jgi:hypothetical protein
MVDPLMIVLGVVFSAICLGMLSLVQRLMEE